MPSLHPPPAEPPVLLPEDPPQVDDILAKIEPWITDHFRETLSSDVPDETQLYGCVNTFLISIFPARRHYMIIPQMLGRVMAEDESEGGSAELGDFGSSGGVHESKHLAPTPAGTEVNKMVPDFLVVKVNPQAVPTINHYIVCLIQVKRKTDTIVEARQQMLKYMDRVSKQPLRAPDMYGYLVMGNSFEVYRICDEDKSISQEGQFDILEDDGDTFVRGLADISCRNWNR